MSVRTKGSVICARVFFLLQTEGQEIRVDETAVIKLNGKIFQGCFFNTVLADIFHKLLLFILFYYAVFYFHVCIRLNVILSVFSGRSSQTFTIDGTIPDEAVPESQGNIFITTESVCS